VTHLLVISHSLWVYCNQVVHDWTLDGLAHATELQVSEELHAQFALTFKTSHSANDIISKDILWIPFCMHLSQIANVGLPMLPYPMKLAASNT